MLGQCYRQTTQHSCSRSRAAALPIKKKAKPSEGEINRTCPLCLYYSRVLVKNIRTYSCRLYYRRGQAKSTRTFRIYFCRRLRARGIEYTEVSAANYIGCDEGVSRETSLWPYRKIDLASKYANSGRIYMTSCLVSTVCGANTLTASASTTCIRVY